MTKAKPSVGIFGNCQAGEIERLLSVHAPLHEACTLVPIKPVYLMSLEERERFIEFVPTLDVLFCQFTTTNYAPATTDNIRSVAKGEVLEFPSIHFTGHLPDLIYLREGSVKGSPADYHSIIIASAFRNGLSEAEAEALYDRADALSGAYLAENYQAGMAELKRREQRCAFTVSDFIAKCGPGQRLFHTMNHPQRDVLFHVANQILDYLKVERLNVDGPDRLSSIQWPVTAAVANCFGVAKERLFSFGSQKITLTKLIASYFNFYRAHSKLIETNMERLNPAWLYL